MCLDGMTRGIRIEHTAFTLASARRACRRNKLMHSKQLNDWDSKNEKKTNFCSGMKETKKLLPKRTQHFQHGLILCRPLESRWTGLFSKQKGTFPGPKSPLELLELLPLKFVTLAGLPCLFFHRICLERNIFQLSTHLFLRKIISMK